MRRLCQVLGVVPRRYYAWQQSQRRATGPRRRTRKRPWSRFKTEELERREWPVFAGLADAQASAAEYFDYYNHERLHSGIGYQFPYLAHQQLLQPTALNCSV